MRGLFMKEIYSIFTKSPFTLLHDHMGKVRETTSLLPSLFDSFKTANHEKIRELMIQISEKEHDADVIKNQIREHLPKSIFMPVSREDVLKLLHRQDNIADHCEDVAYLMAVRKTVLPSKLQPLFTEFTSAVIDTVDTLYKATDMMSNLMEASFSGPSAKEVHEHIVTIESLESLTDKKKFDLSEEMFEQESEIDPISLLMFIKIFDCTSNIADSAQNIGNAFRLMISK